MVLMQPNGSALKPRAIRVPNMATNALVGESRIYVQTCACFARANATVNSSTWVVFRAGKIKNNTCSERLFFFSFAEGQKNSTNFHSMHDLSSIEIERCRVSIRNPTC